MRLRYFHVNITTKREFILHEDLESHMRKRGLKLNALFFNNFFCRIQLPLYSLHSDFVCRKCLLGWGYGEEGN